MPNAWSNPKTALAPFGRRATPLAEQAASRQRCSATAAPILLVLALVVLVLVALVLVVMALVLVVLLLALVS